MRWVSLVLLAAMLDSPAGARELRVCADPNNLPFSNAAQQGFENRIVELIAKDLGATVTYTWWAQRRGNLRETLNSRKCDLVPGVAKGMETLATSVPYYSSTFVSIVRYGRLSRLASFDEPRLKTLRIGVQLIGDDGANIPPAHALSRRGIVANVRGYPVYGDYDRPDPQSPIIDAVAAGGIDVAYAWGPTAGYFAKRAKVALEVRPVTPVIDDGVPMTFAISMGVRRGDQDILNDINLSLRRHAPEIRSILLSYGVPLVG